MKNIILLLLILIILFVYFLPLAVFAIKVLFGMVLIGIAIFIAIKIWIGNEDK